MNLVMHVLITCWILWFGVCNVFPYGGNGWFLNLIAKLHAWSVKWVSENIGIFETACEKTGIRGGGKNQWKETAFQCFQKISLFHVVFVLDLYHIYPEFSQRIMFLPKSGAECCKYELHYFGACLFSPQKCDIYNHFLLWTSQLQRWTWTCACLPYSIVSLFNKFIPHV